MLAFEVTINGKRRYLAGHVDEHSLHLILWGNNRFGRAATVNTSVAVPHDGPGGFATLSYDSEPLSVGDELTIRIVDAEAPDPPLERNDGDGSYKIEIEASSG
jgi:hypothetical protein